MWAGMEELVPDNQIPVIKESKSEISSNGAYQ